MTIINPEKVLKASKEALHYLWVTCLSNYCFPGYFIVSCCMPVSVSSTLYFVNHCSLSTLSKLWTSWLCAITIHSLQLRKTAQPYSIPECTLPFPAAPTCTVKWQNGHFTDPPSSPHCVLMRNRQFLYTNVCICMCTCVHLHIGLYLCIKYVQV